MDSKKLVNLDNLDKLSKGLDARYKEMIQEESERAMLQEQVLDTKINATKSEINTKIANLQSEIDTDVEVEKDRAEAAEAALQAAINGKAPSSHTHDDRYYTESEMNTKLATKADTDHGTHVPTPQTANNAKFLRNDNSWQTVTPANIGAAPSSHNHNDSYYTKTEINTEIDDINETINTKEATLQAAIDKKANSSHTHNVLSMKSDNYKKSTDLPSSYERGETLFFSNNQSTDDRFNGLNYGLVQTLKEYSSGSAAWQFLYPYNSSNDTFYVRNGQYNK